MDLVLLVLVLAIIGFLVWLITTKIPMDPIVKMAIQILVIVVMILFVLRQLGVAIPNVMR
jgi:hypothetical protein